LNALIECLEMCRSLGIDFASVTECVDTSLPSGELVFQMIGAVAPFERSLIAERVKAGLANARANGKVLGRPALRRLTANERTQLRRMRVREKTPFRDLAHRFGVSVWTAHQLCSSKDK
jgi:DNA invertase Pin-like site-specific DNA recombinase